MVSGRILCLGRHGRVGVVIDVLGQSEILVEMRRS
jgi:hypothetical protein